VTVCEDHHDKKLLLPVPEEQLLAWLGEFYGRAVEIEKREVLRHRDLSYVERLWIVDSLPGSLVYKLVLPPWDIEQDLHQRVLIPSISNSAQLYLSAHRGALTALFLEDLGTKSLVTAGNAEIAASVGKELAKMHRAYSYRTDELIQTNVLRTLLPLDYGEFTSALLGQLTDSNMIKKEEAQNIQQLARILAVRLAGEPISLVHGDLFAENIILRGDRLFVVDWSWFTILGVPLMDLATLTMEHPKNGGFCKWKNDVIEAYCFEYARDINHVRELLPYAETLSRLYFLHWLLERRKLSIAGAAVEPVDALIPSVVAELSQLSKKAEG
jgi:Ser/Thr protein kinase RdoA (MazF antagonist)